MTSYPTYMHEALALARNGEYTVAPNPMVGCVIVRDNIIVGRGWHEKPGMPHAEINALREAGELARGASVYVNLEPCTHYGRTPPCVDALINAGVKAVHIPFIDPNPLVDGEGIAKLKTAGINVVVGECVNEAQQLNEIFFHYITTQRPFVIAKWAMTLDGKIATHTGASRWITSDAARAHVHQTRQKMAAILIGAGTALNDNPQLTARTSDGQLTTKQPVRIILASTGNLPLDLQMFDLPGKTLIATTADSSAKWQQSLIQRGVEIIFLPKDTDGKVALIPLLIELGRREISSLLVEGGAQIHTSFFANKLVNKIHAYIAPKLIGGANAPTPFDGAGVAQMNEAQLFAWETCERLGDDIFLQASKRSHSCLAV